MNNNPEFIREAKDIWEYNGSIDSVLDITYSNMNFNIKPKKFVEYCYFQGNKLPIKDKRYYTFSEQGRVVTGNAINEEGEEYLRMSIRLNEEKKVIEMIGEMPKRKIIDISKIKYDSNGNMVEKIKYDNNKQISAYQSFSYSEDNKIVEEKVLHGLGGFIKKYQYDGDFFEYFIESSYDFSNDPFISLLKLDKKAIQANSHISEK